MKTIGILTLLLTSLGVPAYLALPLAIAIALPILLWIGKKTAEKVLGSSKATEPTRNIRRKH